MAFEKREILFTLPEIRDALLMMDLDIGAADITPDMRIVEALHTRDNHLHFHIIRERYAHIYKDHIGQIGVMFRATGALRRDPAKIYEFFIPEDIMPKVILRACRKSGIMLPRSPEKRVIAKDLLIGFQFEMGHTALVLEDA